MRAEGCRKAIWSNECFFARSPAFVVKALQQLAAEGVDLRIIAYVRRHDAWARSAYVQWGLKHKTYGGPLQPFDKWLKGGLRLPQFSKRLQPWLDAFGSAVVVRNMDAVGDVVTDFMNLSGIRPGGIDAVRANDSPPGEELVLRALFNDRFKGKSRALEFDRLLDGKSLRYDLSVDAWLQELMPSDEALRGVAADSEQDRAGLDVLLLANGQPPIDVSPLAAKVFEVDDSKMLAVVCQIMMTQAIKIQKLEAKMSEHAVKSSQTTLVASPQDVVATAESRRATSGGPVFAVSTGRSGSTLVQRVLNCHKDLVVWGEHFGFLNGLANVYVQMIDPNQRLFPVAPDQNSGPSILLPTLRDYAAPLEWVNPWSLEEFKVLLTNFILSYFAGRLEDGQRWGFKEIRYNALPVLHMLRDLFPDGRFIFIHRDPLEVTRSKVFAFTKEARWSRLSDGEKRQRIEVMLNEVHNHYRVHEAFMQRNPALGLVVHYEEIVAHPREVTSRMLVHLGLNPERFDWTLGDQVMGSIITKTKRDDAVFSLIQSVNAEMRDRPDGGSSVV